MQNVFAKVIIVLITFSSCVNSRVKSNSIENLIIESMPLNVIYNIEAGILSSREYEMDGIYGVHIFTNEYLILKKYYIRGRSSPEDYYLKNISQGMDTSVLYPLLDSIYLKNRVGKYSCPKNIRFSNFYDSKYYKINYSRNGKHREINLKIENCFLLKEIDLLDSILNIELKKASVEGAIKTQDFLGSKCKCIEYRENKSFYK